MTTALPTPQVIRHAPEAAASSGAASTPSASLDPIRVLRQHWMGICIAAILGAIMGTGAFVLLDNYFPLYSTEVLFEVRPGLEASTDIGIREFTSDDLAERVAQTHATFIRSREILSGAVKTVDVKNTVWAKQFTDENGIFNQEEAVDDLEETIRAYFVRGTNYFALRWSSHEPADVATVLNAISNTFIETTTSLDLRIYNDNLRAFESSALQTAENIEVLTTNIRTFIREHNLTSLNDPRYSTLFNEIENLNNERAEALRNLGLLQPAYQAAARKLAGEIEPSMQDILNAENDRTVELYKQQLVALKAEARVRREKWGTDHPQTRQIESQIQATEAEANNKIQEIIERNLQAELKTLGDQLEQFTTMVESLDTEATEIEQRIEEQAADQSELDAMRAKREFLESSRDAQQQLINELKIIRVRAEASRVREAVRAQIPREQSFPKVEVMIPLGILLLSGLYVGLIFFKELTNRRIRGANDLRVLPGCNLLGTIPERSEDPTGCDAVEAVIHRHPNSVLAETYRQAYGNVIRPLELGGHRVVQFVSALPGAGTTSVATNFAVAAAASGKRVLLVDGNMRRPRLASAMGLDDKCAGIGDILVDHMNWADAVQHADAGVDVISAGTPAKRVFERLHTKQFEELLQDFLTQYDCVLIDSPPVVVSGDASAIANKVDATVLVVRANEDHRGLVARIIRQLADLQSELVGVVLNRPRRTAGGYLRKNYEAIAEYVETKE
jgi:succinoglycan biosynthesis transport protein ExoP